ncbi:MAG: alpha/beta hydrolase [Planctomycetota bacterium]|nr:alpha/beta hydrolase [Planctomycetota bacterium]
MAGTLLFTPILLAAAAAGAERIARIKDGKRHQPPGEFQDIGGHKLHYQILGAHHLEQDAKLPLVVFEADAADWSTHFGELPHEVAKSSPVLIYDRAGLGWSEEGPGPRDVDTLARELHRLLVDVGPERQALIVAHGFGTLVARMYAHRYPFETAGLVLLDGEYEGFPAEARKRGLPSSEASSILLRLLSWANCFGILRAMRMPVAVPEVPDYDFSPRALSTLNARSFSPGILRAIQAEQDCKEMSLEQVRALSDRFEFPVRILAAGQSANPETSPKDFPTEEFNEVWVEQQRKLLTLSSDSKFALAADCHHYVALGAPDWVQEAIRDAQTAILAPREE